MKKFLAISGLFFLLAVTPVLAFQKNHKFSSYEENCSADGDWENHGQYVSCVAHEHLGGDVVSEAAKSSIGKEDHDEDDEDEDEDDEVSPTPSVSPSVSPNPSASPSPSTSPSPEVSPSPSVSPSPNPLGLGIIETRNTLRGIIEKLQELIAKLQGLL